ncbi:MAG: addiction module toxin RelE [Bacteroidales bacterium]|nr:addiction module toxin RelE [Bacteroidales bacterium]
MRIIIRTPEFDEYYNSLQQKVQEKFDYVMHVIISQYVVSEKFVKKLQTTRLYEMRVSVGNNEYRTLLFAVDNVNFVQSRRVIFLNSFLKKDTRQYRKEIIKAEEILNRYII